MDFAKKILNKYGWKEGDGLGRNNDGISKPLKATLKFDSAGLGADQAARDFNNHWWERVFNEAASNVDVKSGENGVVSMDLKNHEESVEITTKGYSVQKLKKAKNDEKYDNFLQSALLTKTGSEVENAERTTVDDIEVQKFKQLTDEELFKACGGRTAHKGARHGLKLSGKLARLEMQEKELLEKILGKSMEHIHDTTEADTTTKKKKKNKQLNGTEVASDEIVSKKSKKRKMECEERNEDEGHTEKSITQIHKNDTSTEADTTTKKKKKNILLNGTDVATDEVVSKKSKKRKMECEERNEDEVPNEECETQIKSKKKSKKLKGTEDVSKPIEKEKMPETEDDQEKEKKQKKSKNKKKSETGES